MVDGPPAARFTGRLKELIESGYGLIDGEARAALDGMRRQPQPV
jgi:hypothetical protein